MNTLHTVFLPEPSEGPLVRNSRSRPPLKKFGNHWMTEDTVTFNVKARHPYRNNLEVTSHRIQLQTARVEVVANMFFPSRHPVMGDSAYLGTAKAGQARGKG